VVALQRLSKDRGEHRVEQACTKLVPVDFQDSKNPRLWCSNSGYQQAENMIKVPENRREGVCVEAGAKALRGSFLKAFQREGRI